MPQHPCQSFFIETTALSWEFIPQTIKSRDPCIFRLTIAVRTSDQRTDRKTGRKFHGGRGRCLSLLGLKNEPWSPDSTLLVLYEENVVPR